MDETAVEFKVSAEVPEWILIVVVIKMSVTTEHLLNDPFYIVVEVLVEAGRLSNPFISDTCQLAQRLVECGRSCSDWSSWSRRVGSIRVPGCESGR